MEKQSVAGERVLSEEDRRWLEDVLPLGKTVSTGALQNAQGIDTLRKFCENSSTVNEHCLDAIHQLGEEYDRLNSEIEKKLHVIFGEAAAGSLLNESRIPELEWLLDVAVAIDAADTDPDTIRTRLGQLEKEIEEKREILENMKSNRNRFRDVEKNFGNTKYVLERTLKKIEISAKAEKTKLTENMNSLNILPRKRRQYETASSKIEKEMQSRGYQPSFTSTAILEHRARIAALEDRAAALEDALRRYCGLPTDKREAQRQLNDLSQELSKIDTALLEKLKDQ